MAKRGLNDEELRALAKEVGGTRVVRRILAGTTLVVTKPLQKTSRPARMTQGKPVLLPAIPRFVTEEAFRVRSNGEVPIRRFGKKFRERFLPLVERKVPAAALRGDKLAKDSSDGSILATVGADIATRKRARVFLAHVFEFLKTADTACWYMCYAVDAYGLVGALDIDYMKGGWGIEAIDVPDGDEWPADFHFLHSCFTT